jgi:hypothetical protein
MPSFLAWTLHHVMGTDIGNSLGNIIFFTAIAGPLLDLILGFIMEIYWMLSYELPFHILRLLYLITIADLGIGAFQTSFFAAHRGSPFNSKEYYRGLFCCWHLAAAALIKAHYWRWRTRTLEHETRWWRARVFNPPRPRVTRAAAEKMAEEAGPDAVVHIEIGAVPVCELL